MNREQKKQKTRDRLLSASRELFNEQGFDDTTVAQIAERAGVAKGTFFNYFDSKEEVICDLELLTSLEMADPILRTPGPVVPRMKALIIEVVNQLKYTKSLTQVIFAGMYSNEKVVRSQAEQFRHFYGTLAPLVEQAQKQGEVTDTIPAVTIVQMAVQTYLGVLALWCTDEEDSHLSGQMAMAFEVFFDGIAPRSKP